MESQKPRMALYVKRSFGEKMNASFDFIKENFKILLKFITYFLLPLALVQSWSLNSAVSAIGANALNERGSGLEALQQLGMLYLTHYGLFMLVYSLSMLIMTSLVYAMIKLYNSRENRLVGVSFKELRPLFFKNIWQLIFVMIGMMGVILLLGGIVVVLAVATPFSLLLTLPGLIAISVPLSLWAIIYLFEDTSYPSAFAKSFRLGFATWGGIFLIGLVMGFISNILQMVTAVPWYVAYVVKLLFSMSEAGAEASTSPGYEFILYLLGIIQTFGGYLAMLFPLVGLVYQYGHASEVIDSVTVESDIDNFDQL